MKVVTTTGVIRDVLRNVACAHDRVEELMGPGVDPHLYTPRGSDLAALLGADLTFSTGLMLEPGVVRVQDEDSSERIDLNTLAGGIDRAALLVSPETGSYDPHVWLDVSMWAGTIDGVAWHLARMRAPHADEYRANAERYRERLLRLDAYVRERVARVPPARRVLVTAHHAFGYFGRAYGFEVRALQGTRTSLLASTDAAVEALADFVVERGVPVLFTETSVGHGGLERVQRAVRARGREVGIAGPLYSDALGEPGTPQGTYEGMIRHDVETIVRALGRDPPE